ncbi:MAG: OmpA family protein [Acidobacteriota bacterium]|nr:OmpA family protein [Acidobacteriota bacterium]
MRRIATGLAAMTCALLAIHDARALSVQLHDVQFPERRTIDVPFGARPGAPKARLGAEVAFKDGQARIEVSYERMKPAILYGGDVTCYVLWAVTRGGAAENLGELIVEDRDARYEFTTGKKSFALIVTAEPYYLVSRPSELLVFVSGPVEKKRAASEKFAFSGFAPAPKHAITDVSVIAWDDDTPLVLLQARKAVELATERGAGTHAPRLLQEARQALDGANSLSTRSPRSRNLLDLARRAVALGNEAINVTMNRLEGIELERTIAARRAEMAALEKRASEAEASADAASAEARRAAEESSRTRAQVEEARLQIAATTKEKERMAVETAALRQEKSTIEASMASLRAERAELQQGMASLSEEKTQLSGRLQEALSHVAETKESARGFIVSLPDILFDTGQSTLKPEAELTLAKLSGILLVMPDLGATIEGHTDSTGSADFNLDLSQRRALAVMEFMIRQGIVPDKMKSVGYGLERPVADNATREGRAKNRRVEIVIAESAGR